jgi:hypothetical protein
LARLKTLQLGVVPTNQRLRRVIRGIGDTTQEVLYFLGLRDYLAKSKQFVVRLLMTKDVGVK